MHHKHSKILLLFLYFFMVISVVATGHVNAASFQLTWVDNSQNEDGFNIERKLNINGTFSLIATVGPDVTSYVDDNLANTTTYCYRVNAFNDAGNSAYTNEACGTTTATSPPSSGNTISTNIANGAILSGSSVVWTATPTGSPVRVEFFIDGALLSTENVSPYQFNGDPSGTLNTNTLSNGSHQLKVRAIYSDNSTAEQTVTVNVSNGATPTPPPTAPPPPSSTVTATLLGQTGEDITGPYSETPNGIQDVHIRLSGVQSTITRVKITDTGDGIWETPYNNQGNWIVAIRPQTNPSVVDLYFDFWQQSSSFTLNLTFADGSTQTIQTSTAATPTPPPTPPPFLQRSLQHCLARREKISQVPTSETPDGIQDVHIRLSGVQSTITRVKITDTGDGVWETPYNGQGNWIVAIRPQTNPSVVDLYFDFWQQSSSFTLNLTFANGSTQTIQTSTLLSTASLSSDTIVTLTATPVAGSTTATFQTAANQLITKIGVFRPDTGEWFLDRSGNGQWDGCSVDTCITSFGQPGDLPTIGSWSGAGTISIGTFNPTAGMWQLDRNGNGRWDGCAVDTCITSFGQPKDLPATRGIAGFTEIIIGTFQPQQGLWKFDLNGNNTFDNCSIDECDDNFGALGDIPVVGDWNGSGTEEIGVFRPSTGEWFLDVNGNGQWDGCRVDKCIEHFGVGDDFPVVGDWSGTGEVRIGVFRPSTGEWFLDMNGNGKFDGCAVDACPGPFGQPGDLPVVGKW